MTYSQRITPLEWPIVPVRKIVHRVKKLGLFIALLTFSMYVGYQLQANHTNLVPASWNPSEIERTTDDLSSHGYLTASPQQIAKSPPITAKTPSTVVVNGTAQYKTQTLGRFAETLASVADSTHTVIMACVDTGYLDMGLNLYETSFKRFNITNYLFLGIDVEICKHMSKYSIPCLPLESVGEPDGPSRFGSVSFRRKTHFKTRVILEGLLLGYNVLITDVDIVFLQNPLLHLGKQCGDCDIAISDDINSGNSGFYFTRPTAAAIKMHTLANAMAEREGEIYSNQAILDIVMRNMTSKNEIQVVDLPPEQYANGREYFDWGRRMYVGDNPCKECIIVHNNWLMSKDQKVYRFQEVGMWLVDINGYYSDPNRKYLTYECDQTQDAFDEEADRKHLMVALYMGHLLNRTLILPIFNKVRGACSQHRCRKIAATLISICDLKTFNKYIGLNYREHSFLVHPKVPTSVKTSISPTVILRYNSTTQSLGYDGRTLTMDTSFQLSNGLKSLEKYSIIRFSDPKNILSWFNAAFDDYITSNIYRALSIKN